MYGISAVGMDPNQISRWSAVQRPSGSSGTLAVARVAPAQTTPVPPVSQVSPVQREDTPPIQQGPQLPSVREGADPVEMAVRGRIQYLDNEGMPQAANGAQTAQAAEEDPSAQKVPSEETPSPQEVMEEGECQTCKERKYQDGSDDPGVSYQTPTNIDPDVAASAVRGHEQEHVVREQAKAQREGREVVSQSVSLHTAICPECGKVYVSGGTTRTTTRAAEAAQRYAQAEQETPQSGLFQAVA